MGALSTLASVGINAATSRSKAKAASDEIQAEAERDVAEVRNRDAAERQLRERKLKESTARQRALSASSGTGGAGGSAAAVRRGLEARTQEDDAIAVRERELAVHNIRARANAQKRRNLLDSQTSMTKQAVGGAMGLGRSLLDG